MKQVSRLGLWTIIFLMTLCLTASSSWAQGKGKGGGGGGGGGGSDPPPSGPPPGAPEVRYDVVRVTPPPGMGGVLVHMMAKESGEIIAAADVDFHTFSYYSKYRTRNLRDSDGVWHELLPPPEALVGSNDRWDVRAISDTGRFIMFTHNPLNASGQQQPPWRIWVWDRLFDQWHFALQWEDRIINPCAINDFGEFVFTGRGPGPSGANNTFWTRFVCNWYLDGEPAVPSGPDVATNPYSSAHFNRVSTLTNSGFLTTSSFNVDGTNYGLRLVASVSPNGVEFLLDRLVPPHFTRDKNPKGSLDSSASTASDVNEAGDVTGWTRVDRDTGQACIHLASGELVLIHPSSVGNVGSRGVSINDQRWVFGYYAHAASSGGIESFLGIPGFTPVPLTDLIVGGDVQQYLTAHAVQSSLSTGSGLGRSSISNDGVILTIRERIEPYFPESDYEAYLLIPRSP